jgi:hypothetical protein
MTSTGTTWPVLLLKSGTPDPKLQGSLIPTICPYPNAGHEHIA